MMPSRPTPAEMSGFVRAVRATASAARGASRMRTRPSRNIDTTNPTKKPIAPIRLASPTSNFSTSPPTCEPDVRTGSLSP